ncbi:hypothetical protein PQX77_022065 [Marasmius sp. AFHP31]|nr:hypothetical protein PQX77_022065 [Marasmius sp. AFHP31]
MPTNSTHRCFAVSSVQSLSTSHNTRLEIHAPGIGSGVFTQIGQDIALASNGVCLFAAEAEDIFVSCIRLLAAGCLNNNHNPSPSPLLIPTVTSPADLFHTRSPTSPHRNSTMGSTP